MRPSSRDPMNHRLTRARMPKGILDLPVESVAPQLRLDGGRTLVIILVLGPTGAGKSSFIKGISGDQSVVVGDSLSSETSAIRSYKVSLRDVNLTLVDTPGFDDSHRSNSQIVEQILEWLAAKYRSGIELAGLIYVHSIMSPRMQGTALQNLRMLKKLVGKDSMSKVTLATSFWDQVEPSKGLERERALQESPDFFATMIRGGAGYMRLNDHTAILDVLGRMAATGSVVLHCQKEMIDGNIRAASTSAAQISSLDLEVQREKHRDEVKAIMRRADENAARQRLARDREKERLRLQLAQQDRQAEQRMIEERHRYEAMLGAQQREREAETGRLKRIQQEQERINARLAAQNRQRREMYQNQYPYLNQEHGHRGCTIL